MAFGQLTHTGSNCFSRHKSYRVFLTRFIEGEKIKFQGFQQLNYFLLQPIYLPRHKGGAFFNFFLTAFW